MKRGGGVKKWALAIAIAIVFNLFVHYSIATFYKEPKYEDFCLQNGPRSAYYTKPIPVSADPCTFEPPKNLTENCTPSYGYIQYSDYNSSGCPKSAYCETCGVESEKARNRYNSNVFFARVIIGVAALIAGLLIVVPAVSTGFLGGGILSIIIGTIANWSNLANFFRVLILGAVLALLIWLGYKKLKD